VEIHGELNPEIWLEAAVQSSESEETEVDK
jgi:hypothetical protein